MKKTIARMRTWLRSTDPMPFRDNKHVELLCQIADSRVRRWSKVVVAGLIASNLLLPPLLSAALSATEREALSLLDLVGSATLYLAPLCLVTHVLSSALWWAGFRGGAVGGGGIAQGHVELKQ